MEPVNGFARVVLMDGARLLAAYCDGLLNDTLPFWLNPCVDRRHGGCRWSLIVIDRSLIPTRVFGSRKDSSLTGLHEYRRAFQEFRRHAELV